MTVLKAVLMQAKGENHCNEIYKPWNWSIAPKMLKHSSIRRWGNALIFLKEVNFPPTILKISNVTMNKFNSYLSKTTSLEMGQARERVWERGRVIALPTFLTGGIAPIFKDWRYKSKYGTCTQHRAYRK